MNKTKMTLIAVGGVLTVVVLAAAAFTYLAWAGKSAALTGDDESDGLETVVETVEQLSRKSVFPCAESLKVLTDSNANVQEWKDEAFKLAARGDRPIPPTTDAQFKSMIVDDARYLATLPEGSTNKIVTADFDFGPFKPYISEGAMPEAAQLKKLQREWDDFKTIVETLVPCGVTRVTRLEVKAAQAAVVEETPKKGAKKGAKKQAKVVETFKPDSRTYVIGMKATPAALVKALNALATIDRFMVVDDFSFSLERDAIATALGGEKKEETQQTSGRRRRRAVVEEETTEQAGDAAAPKVTGVTDPATDAAFDASVTITVHDFKSLEETNEEGEESK